MAVRCAVVAMLVTIAGCSTSSSHTSYARLRLPPAADGSGSDAWWAESAPCPEGGRLRGAAPPAGLHVWCDDGIGLPHGRATAWRRNGEILSDGYFEDGERHGAWRRWDIVGEVDETTWVRGERQSRGDEAYLSVIVLDVNGVYPVGGAQVALLCDRVGLQPSGTGWTDSTGRLSLGPLEPDDCDLVVAHPSNGGHARERVAVEGGLARVEVRLP